MNEHKHKQSRLNKNTNHQQHQQQADLTPSQITSHRSQITQQRAAMNQDKPPANSGAKILIKKEVITPPRGTGRTHDTRLRKQLSEIHTILSLPPPLPNLPAKLKQRTPTYRIDPDAPKPNCSKYDNRFVGCCTCSQK